MKIKKENGITLVALILTIIILIILTAVVIKSIVNMDLITISAEAAEKYLEQEQVEKNELDKIEDFLKGDLGKVEGAIKFGELEWKEGKASVTVTKMIPEEYRIQYKVVNKEGETIREYSEIESGGKIEDLSLGDIVIARLTDGEKFSRDTATIEVTDKNPPTLTVDIKEIKSSKIIVEAKVEDLEAGMPEEPEYEYYIKASGAKSYPEIPTYKGKDKLVEFTGLDHDTEYDIKIVTKDIARKCRNRRNEKSKDRKNTRWSRRRKCNRGNNI